MLASLYCGITVVRTLPDLDLITDTLSRTRVLSHGMVEIMMSARDYRFSSL